MKYQLVFQYYARGPSDAEGLIAIENWLVAHLKSHPEMADVDGHDFGAGEGNIFVHTDAPAEVFGELRPHLERLPGFERMRAGYRSFEEDDYVSLWPKDAKSFSVA